MSLLLIVISTVLRRPVCGRFVGALPNASLASRHVCTASSRQTTMKVQSFKDYLINNTVIFITKVTYNYWLPSQV